MVYLQFIELSHIYMFRASAGLLVGMFHSYQQACWQSTQQYNKYHLPQYTLYILMVIAIQNFKDYDLIFPLVLYGCETWSLTLWEKCRLRVLENRALRRIFGPKRDEVWYMINGNGIFSTGIRRKNTQIPNLMKIRSVGAELLHCGQTDRHDEADSRFIRNFAKVLTTPRQKQRRPAVCIQK
jgi:hypothetical protein